MILTCPSCATRYTVADGAIPPGGRLVRCASCKHRWHQDPDPAEGETTPIAGGVDGQDFPAPEPDSHPAGESGGKPDPAYGTTHAHPDSPPSPEDYEADPDANPLPGPEPVTPAASTLTSNGFSEGRDENSAARRFAATMPEQHDSAAAEDTDYSPAYGHGPDAPPAADAATAVNQQWVDDTPASSATPPSGSVRAERAYSFDDSIEEEDAPPRSRLPMLLLGGLLLIAAIAAALWFLAPTSLRQRLGLATNTDTPLLLQVEQNSRQQLASGNQLLEVSGRVINPTDSAQKVPPLQAQLRSLEQKVVYRWTIPPPARVLAPGGSASFNSAELNIPAAAACLDVSFGDLKQQTPCRSVPAAGTRAS
jgi:predicted Zn finger-like uncharacterized protein